MPHTLTISQGKYLVIIKYLFCKGKIILQSQSNRIPSVQNTNDHVDTF